MIISIRKEQNGVVYLDKTALNRFTEHELEQSPYNFSFIEVDDEYEDCESSDFNDDLSFSLEKYNARKNKIKNTKRIQELKQNLVNTDYQAIKFAEGQILLEDYEPIKKQRQDWRDEINDLEEDEAENIDTENNEEIDKPIKD